MMPARLRACAFVAYDDGSVRTLDTVARAAGARLVDSATYGDSVEAWRGWLMAQRSPLLVCGTSAFVSPDLDRVGRPRGPPDFLMIQRN